MPKAWHLLVAICFGMPGAAAVSYAGVEAAGVRGYAVIIPVSTVLGVACARLLEAARLRTAAHITRTSGSLPGWYPPALYVAAILWMVIAWALGVGPETSWRMTGSRAQ